ncbi:MAG TPA: membrane protein insertion efficiency factor YidD [Candidatus Levybacteria bacterium]|nr:membrane protein insertion efficiency factor YidD [Candidatus Levybacteria bacterium]
MKKLVLLSIYAYQSISFIPKGIAQTVFGTVDQCKFTPTCSNYMIQAVEKYGVIKGVRMGIQRVSRCRPGKSGGYDPVK